MATTMDLREICVEEISLEGLEGITLPTLWRRLEAREPALPYKLSDPLKEYLWKFILQHGPLDVLQIPKVRPEPQIFDRFQQQDPTKTAVAQAPDELGTFVEIYSASPLVNVEGVRGACSDFHERLHVKEDICSQSYTLAESFKLYGERRLIVVASQQLRENVLLTGNLSSIVLCRLTDIAYCVLEHIARSRWQGDLQSVLGKLNFGEKNVHIHYVVDNLLKLALVVKKNHSYKCLRNNRNIFQILVLLTKYQRDCETFSTRAIQTITNILKDSPNNTANVGELRERSLLDVRAFKTAYHAILKTGTVAVEDHGSGKRTLYGRSMRLVQKSSTVVTHEDDDEEDIARMFKGGFASQPLILERPVLYQSYQFVLNKGAKGVTQRGVLGFLKGYGKLEARNVCKMLAKMKLVNVVLVDHGKQRVQTYIPKNLIAQNSKSMEFSDQRKKMQQLLVETTKFGVERDDSQNDSEQNETIDSIISSIHEESLSQTPDRKALAICSPSHKTDIDGMNILSRTDRLSCILRGEAAPSPSHLKKWDAHLTTRKIKRHNIILEQLNEDKIIEGFRSLQKTLAESEEKEGVTTKIDKKTIVRLIDKMHYDGVLQHSVIPITHNDRTEHFHFIMALDCPPRLLKFAVDQARFKLLGDEENRVARLQQQRLKEEMKEERRLRKEHEENLLDPNYQETFLVKGDEKLATKLFLPKFKRLRVIHNLLWYLLYGHPHSIDWSPEMGIFNPDELGVYCDEMNWKRFLPPAPIHFFDDTRWLQLGDVAVILPLSIFCQFHRISYKVDNLEMYLADEEKRHMLVRHLPQEVRTYLFYKRRYMFSLMMCIEQLVFMGLVTIRRGRSGRNVNLPKENMMVYVHKNASILDTRSSMKRHIKVEEKRYDRLRFILKTQVDLDAYWFKLQDICVQTKLGFTEYQEPEYDMMRKYLGLTELKKFVASFDGSDPKALDNGDIPGDQRGAAGLDSSMFSYLYRNWRSKPHHRIGDLKLQRHEESETTSNRLPKLRQRNLTLEPARKKPANASEPLIPIEQDSSAPETLSVSKIKPSIQRTHSKRRDKSQKVVEKRADIDGRDSTSSTQRGKNDKTNDTASAQTTASPVNSRTAKKRRLSTSSEKAAKKVKGKVDEKKEGKKVLGRKNPVAEKEPKVVPVSNIGRNERVKGGKGVKRKQSPFFLDLPTKKLRVERKRRTTQQPKFIKQGRQRVKYVDKKDLEAITNRKGRLRVTFSQSEDAFLLICHVATSLLTSLYWKKQHRPRKQVISWLAVRDVIQKVLPESYDKTSYSMNRRTITLMKNSETRICHDISVADTKADKEFLNKNLPNDFDLEFDFEKTEDLFRHLVALLRERFKTKPGLFCDEIPDTRDEVLKHFSPKTILRKIGEKIRRRRFFNDYVQSQSDVKRATAENMIYIALAMGDAEFSVYQAYKAFEAFPESILSEVLVLLQGNGIVSTKPNLVRRLPFGIRSHRLAYSFDLSLRAVTPLEVIDQLSQVLTVAEDLKTDSDVSPGQIFLYSYLMAKGPVKFSIQIPEQVILPEPPNRTLFENQFSSMLEKYRKETEFNAGEESLAETSVMATAARILRDNLNDEQDARHGTTEKDVESDDKKLKVAEILRLFNRHPSYTNWLMLINSQRSEAPSVSKFLNINSALNPDSVVLSPCEVTLEDCNKLLQKYSQTGNAKKISANLNSIKICQEKSGKNWEYELANSKQAYILKAIFETVDKSAELGMTKEEICDSVEFGFWSVRSVVDDLQKKKVLFSVGICEKKYVTYNHIQGWAAKGFNFLGQEDKFQSEIEYEISLLQSFSEDKNGTNSNSKDGSSANPDLDGNSVALPAEATRSVMNRYHEIDFICRPWHTIYGFVSFKAAKRLLLSVYLKILSSPGICREDVIGSFAFQRICVVELLEILLEVGCIKECVIERAVSRLFGTQPAKKKIIYYETTQDGLLTIGQWVEAANKLIGRAKLMYPDSDG